MAVSRCPVCHGVLGQDLLEGLCARCLSEMLFDPPLDSAETSIIPSDGLETRSLVSIPGFTATAEIARGGMGIVYRAIQHQPRRDVALKMLLPHQLGSSEMRQRFQLEARTIATLDHPGILPVYQVGESDGIPFFTMKLAGGGTLSERLSGFCGQWMRIAELVIALAEAVHFAHQRGVLHRDLKPGNVLFDESGQPYVSDFGLAKVLEDETNVTATFDLIGTPRYLPPEVITGGVSSATVAGDVYGLCTILYELLSQRAIFEGANPRELMRKITDEDPAAPSRFVPGVPVDLETICLRGLAKESMKRFASAAELAADLRRWRMGEPIESRPIGRFERVRMWARRHRREAAMGSVIAGLLLTLLIGSTVATIKMAATTEELRRERDRANEELVRSQLIQCTASRLADQLGQTATNLALLPRVFAGAAVSMASEIREEFLANLTLHDLVQTARSIPRLESAEVTAVDPNMRLSAELEPGGFIQFRRLDGSGLEWRWRRDISNEVDTVTFDPSGRYATVTFRSSTDAILDLQRQQLVRYVPGDWGGFTSKGGAYIHASPRGSYHLVELESGRTLADVRGDDRNWINFYTDPNARDYRFMVAMQGRIEIWGLGVKLATPGPVVTLALPNRAISFNWRSEILAAGGERGEIYLWNLRDGELREIRAHQGDVESVLLSPDGELLFSTAKSGPTFLWHVPTLERLGVTPGWRPIQFDRSGEELAVVSAREIRVLRRIRPSGSRLLRLHGEGGSAIRGADFKPDGSKLAVAQQDGVTVLDAESGARETILRQLGAHAVFWNAAGNRLAVVGRRDVRRFDVDPATGSLQWKRVSAEIFPDATWLNHAVRSVDRRSIGVSGVLGRLGILGMDSLEPVDWLRNSGPLRLIHLAGSGDPAWIADPTRLQLGLVRRSGVVLQTLPLELGAEPRFAPEGSLVAMSGRRNLRVVSTNTGAEIHTLPIEEIPQPSPPVAWSGDGKVLAVAARAERIDFFTTDTWERFASVPTPVFQTVTWMEFAVDGRPLGVGSGDGLLQLWSLTELRDAAAARGIPIRVPAGTAGPLARFNWNPLTLVSPELDQLRAPAAPESGEFDPARVPARSTACTSRQIDLTRFYNRNLDPDGTDWNPGGNGTPTLHRIAGQQFDLRGRIMITAQSLPNNLNANLPPATDLPHLAGANPTAVSGIPIRQPARRLHFLGASDFGYKREGQPVVAHVVVTLANGATYRVPVRLGVEISAQWIDPADGGAEQVAFFFMSRGTEENSRYLGLRRFSWENPHPEVPVDHIDWVGTQSLYRREYAPFLAGITVEPPEP